ncbi:unnamed protein product [Spirodela intermedia]|uniref:Uncharacterized protein n=1 Tax=Spirodela intermedia TaxID=51605 RepID=A0A7I8K3Q2_SPIIN|nr:unnamed protein product [Spirodela intermedia]
MADLPVKGSVTPLASMIPAEEAHNAAKRVREAISERQKELDRLSLFSSENNNLINLVQRLPDELSHEIMVPFGKAAFFPGRLIHTNEFLVLLGEGYYVERAAKQTVDILQRRGKDLDSQVESLKAMITDLDTEAKFFSATAVEAEEGLVEIREDYVEDFPAENKAESGGTQISEEEYARIMSRLDELEDEEKAAECASSDEETDRAHASSADSSFPHAFDGHGIRASLEAQLKDLGQSPEGKGVGQKQAAAGLPSVREYERHESIESPMKGLVDEETLQRVAENSAADFPERSLRAGSDLPKAFTGSIIERSHGLPPTAPDKDAANQAPLTNSSKPASRFKMRRGNR